MHIKELSIMEFSQVVKNHPLSNYYQTINQALLCGEFGFDYDLIGLCDNTNIYAASLILFKKINNCYYGYAPRGFLIDYNDKELLNEFTKKLIYFYKDKNIAFIKVNPLVIIGELDKKTFETKYNDNYYIKSYLETDGYLKLKDNLYFESMLPRFTGIIPLRNFDFYSLSKNTRNKIKKGYRKGLRIEIKDRSFLDIYLSFLNNIDKYYYQTLYNVYSKNDEIDLFLISINYEKYLINSQNFYVKESDKNNLLNEKMVKVASNKNINRKMNSDKVLLTYKNDIADASKLLNENEDIFIGGALVIKHNNSVTVISSGFDRKYKRFVPNYYLYYRIMDYYKDDYSYIDLNGLSGDFSKDSKYYGLNKFKLGFNPKVYEYIGEYDLVVDEKLYKYLIKNNYLLKEFNKKINQEK